MLLRGSPGGGGDRVEGEQDPTSRCPPQDAGHDGRDAQAGEGPQEQFVKVAGALIGGAEADSSGEGLLALGLQSWVVLEAAIGFRRSAGLVEEASFDAGLAGGRSGAEAVVDERICGGDERCAGDQEQPRAGQRDPGPHAAATEDSAMQSGQCHG